MSDGLTNPMWRLRQHVSDLRSIIDSALPAHTKAYMLYEYELKVGCSRLFPSPTVLLAKPRWFAPSYESECGPLVEEFTKLLRETVGDEIYDQPFPPVVLPATDPLAQAVLDELARLTETQLVSWYNIYDDAVSFRLEQAVYAWRDSLPHADRG